jgi:hypothetical protein
VKNLSGILIAFGLCGTEELLQRIVAVNTNSRRADSFGLSVSDAFAH